MENGFFTLKAISWSIIIALAGFAFLRAYARKKLQSLYFNSYYNDVLTKDKYKVKAKTED